MVFTPTILRIDDGPDTDASVDSDTIDLEESAVSTLDMRPFREDLHRARNCFESFIPREGKGLPEEYMQECRATVYQWLNVILNMHRSINEAAGFPAECDVDIMLLPNHWGWRLQTVQRHVRTHFPSLEHLSRENDLSHMIDTQALELVIQGIDEVLAGTSERIWRPRGSHLQVVADDAHTDCVSVIAFPHD